MRRFAKLTHEGRSVYVDPALVGTIKTRASGYKEVTALFGRTQFSDTVDDRYVRPLAVCDESPDEAYRRLAAAGQVVTKADMEKIADELNEAAWMSGSAARARLLTTVSIDDVKEIVLRPIQDMFNKMKSTVLAALWVAEGEEPPK